MGCRRRPHEEDQAAAGHDPGVGQHGPVQAAAVQLDPLHVDIPRALVAGLDREGPPPVQVQLGPAHQRAAQGVLPRPGAHGVEAQGAQHVPGGHLARVVVAAQALGAGAVHGVHDGAHPGLGLPGPVAPVVEIRDVVARFVAVHVVADDAVAGDVLGVGDVLVAQLHGEERVQVRAEAVGAAHQLHQRRHVLGHVQAVVPGVALDEALAVRWPWCRSRAASCRRVAGAA